MRFSILVPWVLASFLVVMPAVVSAQATTPARDPFETTQAQTYCVFRCDTGSASRSGSDEYAKWHADTMATDVCRPTCVNHCDTVCGQQTVQGAAGAAGGTTSPTRRGQPRAPTAGAEPIQTTARCSMNAGTNTSLTPICYQYDPLTRASAGQAAGTTGGANQGICVFRCSGQTTWQGAQMDSCSPQGCQQRCGSICGGTCTAETALCQPLPGVGQPTFPASTEAPAGGAAGAAAGGAAGTSQDGAQRSAVTVGYGLRDPLGGVSLQRLVAGIIRFVIGMIGALFLGLFVWAGVLWTTAGGEMDQVKSAKQTMQNAVIGLIIVVGSWTIVSLVIEYTNTILESTKTGV